MLDKVLVVADDLSQWMGLRSILDGLGIARVVKASTHDDAEGAAATGFDAVFLSVSMPDRLALRVTRAAARACPVPLLIAVSDGPHPDLFDLARAGVQKHLCWPASPQQVRSCLDAEAAFNSALESIVGFLIGRVGVRDAQKVLRHLMLRDALAASQGSRRAAARILGVTRPAVQKMLRENDSEELTDSLHPAAPHRAFAGK